MSSKKSVENRALGKQIDAERIAADLSQRDFASRAGINYETFRRIIDGSRDINITQIIGSAQVAGITPEELIRRAMDRVPQIARREMSEQQGTNVTQLRPSEDRSINWDAYKGDRAANPSTDEATEPEQD